MAYLFAWKIIVRVRTKNVYPGALYPCRTRNCNCLTVILGWIVSYDILRRFRQIFFEEQKITNIHEALTP